MARNTITSTGIAIAQLQALLDFWDTGTINAQSRLQLFEGSQPANPSVAAGSTPVFEILLDEPNPVSLATGSSPGAEATINNLPKTALAAFNTVSGGLAWHRVINRNQQGVIDGNISTSPGTTNIFANKLGYTTGEQISLQSPFTLHHPQGPAG